MILAIGDLLFRRFVVRLEVRVNGPGTFALAQALFMIGRISPANAERAAAQDSARSGRTWIVLGGGERAQLHAVRGLPGDRDPRVRGRGAAARARPPRGAADQRR